MKKSKSLISLLLLLSILLSAFSLTAYAAEEEPVTDETPMPEQTVEPAPVEVTNLEELLSAIEAAEDGDNIVLCNQINIAESCVIGQADKTITLTPKDTFTSGAFLQLYSAEKSSIKIQSLILDGSNTALSAITVDTVDKSPDIEVSISNVTIQNFCESFSIVTVNTPSVSFDNCTLTNNSARRSAGIDINSSGEAEISNCTLIGNTTQGFGGAIRCAGTATITNTKIANNTAKSDLSRVGGGIAIESGASCEISNCVITNNTADLGGGISVAGSVTISDTLLYGNIGTKGASDIYAIGKVPIIVGYTGTMNDIYTENEPIGFYADYFENPFNATENAVFLGEALTISIAEHNFGAKFIFAADLPQEDTPVTDTPITPTVPETPEEPDNAPAPIRPTRPIHIYRPSIEQKQEEEPEKLVLSCGGATLDISNTLALWGYSDNQLHENDPIARAQMAVLLYRSLTAESKAVLSENTSIFADVESGAWYYDAVSALSSAGIINGCNGLFCPNDNLTWGQLVALLTRFVAPKTATTPNSVTYSEHWAYDNIVTAVAYGWIDDAVTFEPDRIVTRAEAVDFVNSIFESC